MIFKRINENTVNCHISKEDLQESGIRIDDLLMQKKETLQNLRDAVQRAAVQENFTLDGHFNTMQLAVLRDSSISLTLSQERAIPDSLFSNAGKELLDAARANWTGENRESEEESGVVRYDTLVMVRSRLSEGRIAAVVNIEGQNDPYPLGRTGRRVQYTAV